MRLLAVALLVTSGLAEDGKLSQAEARKLKNPVAYTKASIDRGRTLFLQMCTGCHGSDGKAETAVIAEATDLTAPKRYKSGTSEGEIFRSIRDGAGDQMPAFKSQIETEEDIWNLVNFTRSLWSEAERRELKKE